MKDKTKQIVRIDNYTRFCLSAIVVLLSVLILGLWADMGDVNSRAYAKQPRYKDSASRDAVLQGRWGTSSAPGKMAATQKETNMKLDVLIGLFKTGKAKVQTVKPSSGVIGRVKTSATISK